MKTNTRNVFVGVILMIVMLLGISMLTACNDVSLDKLQNEYGIVIDGGGFEEGSTLVSNEIAVSTEEATEVLAAIADQNYDKDGSVYIFDIYVTKDGAKVQPSGKVKVSVPLPNIQVDNYLVFHVKADNSVENLVPTVADGKISFETSSFSYFVIAEAAPDEHVHNYVWVEGTEPTCEKEGVVAHYHCDGCGKNFNPNYGEIETVSIPKAEHKYGSMYWGKSANFFHDGNIEYYQCAVCEKYFDAEFNEVETVVIPKYSTNLSICVNGTPTALVIVEQRDGFISWSLEGLSVAKGDVITLCQTDNAEIKHNYFAEGNVDEDGKILTTAAAANVVLTATPNGLMLFIDGYKYEGIVIEINGVQYPMIYTAYPDETTTYIYGYVNFVVGDKFVIVDNVSGTVYDYDDLDPVFAWDTWDYHRGDNGEFVIDYAARYGIEFDDGGNKKIYINKVFAPLDGSSYELTFENSDTESVSLTQMQFETGSEAYEDLLWYIAHEDVVNNEDIVSYIGEKGLYVYIVKLQLEEGMKFNIKNLTANSTITADHLAEVYTESGCITKDGDYIKVLVGGYYSIVYMPCYYGFMIEEAENPADVYMYVDGNFVPLMKDADGVVTYEGLVADTSTNIMFTDNTYTTYLPITLDSQTNSSIAHVIQSNGMSMLFFDKAGTYNLSYNVETGVLSITSVGGDDNQGDGDESGSIDDYVIFISVLDNTNGNQTLYPTKNPEKPSELYVRVETIAANSHISVSAMSKADYSTTSYGTLENTDSSVASNLTAEIITVKVAGPIDIYFNFETKTVRIVAVSGSTEEKALPKDIYISTTETYTLVENTENADELCYLGLVLESYDDFRIRDTENNYISDITLASGTTGAQTSGSSVMVEADGTFNIYINKTTHEVRIVSVSGGSCAEGACVYGEGVVTKEPTHLEEGIKTYTCTICSKTKEEPIAKTSEHSFGNWIPSEADEEKHCRECACGETEYGKCTFGPDGICTVCGREKTEESGIIIVISGGTAIFVGKEAVTSNSTLYGENAIVYVAQPNDVLNVTLNDQDGRVFKHWASATGTIIPDEDFSMLVLKNGYYYPVFEDADEFLNYKTVFAGNCEEGTLYMSTNSKGDIKYELEFANNGRHDLTVCASYDSQYHVQKCVLCGELVFEAHTEQTSEVAQQPTHVEEGVMRHECSCGYSWTESIPVTDAHSVNYYDWTIVEESKNGQYGKYRVSCQFCDYSEEYWYLGGLDFVSFIDGKMIHYKYTYGGKVCHDEYYYNYRNAEGKKVYVWAFQYAYEYSQSADNNDTYIFMYVDDEDSTTIEPIYLSKSRGDKKAEYLWAIYGYAHDVNDWVALLDSPDRNVGCSNGMILGNNMSARVSLFEAQHDYWAEVYNGLRIPTSKEYHDFSGTSWEKYYEGVSSAGREIISFVRDKGTAYQQYFHVDKATGITYGYENHGTSYASIYIMNTYKTIVSPDEFDALDENGKSVSYSYGDIEQDVKALCAKRTAFSKFTLTLPQDPSAFRLIVSAPANSVKLGGYYENVLSNPAQIYNSGNYINLTWQGGDGLVFDRYEIWDFANQQWVVLSDSPNFTLNTTENPIKEAAYVRVIYHEVDVPVAPEETFTITVENGYVEIDGEKYIGTVEVAANTSVYVYANNVAGKSFSSWQISSEGEFPEITDNRFVVSCDGTLTPVYVDTQYHFMCLVDTEGTYVSVNGGEEIDRYTCFTKVGEKFELSTSADPESEVNTFIGWYFIAMKNGTEEYVFISGSKTITYEIVAHKISMEQEGTSLIAVFPAWTTGETMPAEKYVDIRVENGFVNYSTGEVVSESLDNAYSAVSASNMGRATFFDDPTDETVYTAWDVAYRYDIDGEIQHNTAWSYEDEYDYYPAEYWVDDPQYSYPDGVINVTGINQSSGDLEEVVE